jgi:hypothetical protein
MEARPGADASACAPGPSPAAAAPPGAPLRGPPAPSAAEPAGAAPPRGPPPPEPQPRASTSAPAPDSREAYLEQKYGAKEAHAAFTKEQVEGMLDRVLTESTTVRYLLESLKLVRRLSPPARC